MSETLQAVADLPVSSMVCIESQLPDEHTELVLPPPAMLEAHNQTALSAENSTELRIARNRISTGHVFIEPSPEQRKLINIVLHNAGTITFERLRKEHGYRTKTFGRLKQSINATFSLYGLLGNDFIRQERQGDTVFIGLAANALVVPDDEAIKNRYIRPDVKHNHIQELGSTVLGSSGTYIDNYTVRNDKELLELHQLAQTQNVSFYELMNPAEFCRMLSLLSDDSADDDLGAPHDELSHG